MPTCGRCSGRDEGAACRAGSSGVCSRGASRRRAYRAASSQPVPNRWSGSRCFSSLHSSSEAIVTSGSGLATGSGASLRGRASGPRACCGKCGQRDPW